MLTIIGVYLPSSDKGIDCYRKHHLELEKIISGSSLVGAVIVLGDFNAQLGCLRGVRGTGDMNVQGVMVNDVFGRCNLNAISLGSASNRPHYTYESADKQTTVDYIFADEEATSMLG